MSTNIAALMLTGTGVIIAALSVPLVMGKIPPNRYYGVRNAASYSSVERWYRINKYGGKMMLWASLVVCMTGLTGLVIPASCKEVYLFVGMTISSASVIAAAIMTLIRKC